MLTEKSWIYFSATANGTVLMSDICELGMNDLQRLHYLSLTTRNESVLENLVMKNNVKFVMVSIINHFATMSLCSGPHCECVGSDSPLQRANPIYRKFWNKIVNSTYLAAILFFAATYQTSEGSKRISYLYTFKISMGWWIEKSLLTGEKLHWKSGAPYLG